MEKKKRTEPTGRRIAKRSAVLKQHKRSMHLICVIVVLLFGTLSFHAYSLHCKNVVLKRQEAELMAQIKEEEKRTKEVAAYEEYVKTDEYVKDVAEEKLGLVDPNEIIFKPTN